MKRIKYFFILLLVAALSACNRSNSPTLESEDEVLSSTMEDSQLETDVQTAENMQGITEVNKEEQRSYESGLDTSFYFEMLPVDNEAYEILKREYEKIDFSPTFQKGDENTYENYEKIYRQLINNEIPYQDIDGNKTYLKDNELFIDSEGHYAVANNKYYIFDADGDSKQELYVRTITNRIYVFKYDETEEKIYIWDEEVNSPYYLYMGTNAKVWTDGGSIYQYSKLDENATEEITVTFEEFYDMNPQTQEGEIVYLVKLPMYLDSSKQMENSQELLEQAYYIDGECYFCVTEQQFNELTRSFFETYRRIEENISKVEIKY